MWYDEKHFYFKEPKNILKRVFCYHSNFFTNYMLPVTQKKLSLVGTLVNNLCFPRYSRALLDFVMFIQISETVFQRTHQRTSSLDRDIHHETTNVFLRQFCIELTPCSCPNPGTALLYHGEKIKEIAQMFPVCLPTLGTASFEISIKTLKRK